MRNYSYEKDVVLHKNETACRTHFHMKGFALRLETEALVRELRNGQLSGLLVGRGKKSQISRDFQGQIRGKNDEFSRPVLLKNDW